MSGDLEYDQNEAIVLWYELVSSEPYQRCVQFEAASRLRQAIQDGLNRKLTPSDRDAASGRAEAWAVVEQWGRYYSALYEQLKQQQADQSKSKAEQPPSWPDETRDDVPAEYNAQWHQKEPIL